MKEITKAKFREWVQDFKEISGTSPIGMAIPKQNTKTINIFGYEFDVVLDTVLCSFDGVNIYICSNCPPDKFYLFGPDNYYVENEWS